MPRKGVRVAIAFLWSQAVLVAGWWILLWLVPAARAWFVLDGWPEETLLAFLFADAMVLVGGSMLAALALQRQVPWATAMVAAVLGAAVYAFLVCVGAAAFAGSGLLALLLMALCAAGNGLCYELVRR